MPETQPASVVKTVAPVNEPAPELTERQKLVLAIAAKSVAKSKGISVAAAADHIRAQPKAMQELFGSAEGKSLQDLQQLDQHEITSEHPFTDEAAPAEKPAGAD